MQGFGVLLWKDGRKYEGTWMDGKKHGEGVTWYSNGRLSRDIWRYGRIIKPDV
jgi:L1 cell adhesion molecule like protein